MNNLPELIPDNPVTSPKDLKGIFTPHEILFDQNITASERWLLSFIWNLDKGPKKCYASNKYLADMMRTTEDSIKGMLKRLKQKGYINVSKWDGRIRNMEVNMAKYR